MTDEEFKYNILNEIVELRKAIAEVAGETSSLNFTLQAAAMAIESLKE